MQKANKNIPRGNKYILENILLNIFKFYILKYIIKIEKKLPFLIYFKIYSLFKYIILFQNVQFDEMERK